jgi:hypothetical protein
MTDDAPADALGWSDAPAVHLVAKVCPWPRCGSTRFVNCWVRDNGDGSRTQFQVCRACSRRVRFVIERESPPDGGSVVWPLGTMTP